MRWASAQVPRWRCEICGRKPILVHSTQASRQAWICAKLGSTRSSSNHEQHGARFWYMYMYMYRPTVLYCTVTATVTVELVASDKTLTFWYISICNGLAWHETNTDNAVTSFRVCLLCPIVRLCLMSDVLNVLLLLSYSLVDLLSLVYLRGTSLHVNRFRRMSHRR